MMKKTFDEILTESKKKPIVEAANAHLTHFEDFIIINKSKGIKDLVESSRDLINKLQGLESSSNLTVKWDGSPAVFCGINKESGNFFVGTKGVLSKEAKLCFTEKDINTYYSGELADILKYCLKYCSKLGIKNILQGDLMFTPKHKIKKTINGEKVITFKPNTITYSVPLDSDLGKEIDTSELGIIFHTEYNNSSGGPIRSMSTSPSPDIDKLKKVKGFWTSNADIKDVSSKVSISKSELSVINDNIKKIEQTSKSTLNFIDSISSSDGTKLLSFLVHISKNNVEVADNKVIPLAKDFLLSKFSSDKKKKEIEDLIDNKEFLNLVHLISYAVHLKEKILYYLNKVTSFGTFYENSSGELEVVSHEGFVVVNQFGALKLVDRLEFSRLNFMGK